MILSSSFLFSRLEVLWIERMALKNRRFWSTHVCFFVGADGLRHHRRRGLHDRAGQRRRRAGRRRLRRRPAAALALQAFGPRRPRRAAARGGHLRKSRYAVTTRIKKKKKKEKGAIDHLGFVVLGVVCGFFFSFRPIRWVDTESMASRGCRKYPSLSLRGE